MTQDKIYLCADAPKMYDWSNEPFEKGGNVEYIRKDALLDKLNLALKLRTDGNPDIKTDGAQTIKAMINYIESL